MGFSDPGGHQRRHARATRRVGAALGWSLSTWAVALLAAPVGGLGHAVTCVVLLALPAAALLLRGLPETAERHPLAGLRAVRRGRPPGAGEAARL